MAAAEPENVGPENQGVDFDKRGLAQLGARMGRFGACELVEALWKEYRESRDAIVQAIERDDTVVLRRYAHNMKAGCRMLQSEALTRELAEVERLLTWSQIDVAFHELPALLRRYATLLEQARRYFNENRVLP